MFTDEMVEPIDLSMIGLRINRFIEPVNLGWGLMYNYVNSAGRCYVTLTEPHDAYLSWQLDVFIERGWQRDNVSVRNLHSGYVIELLAKHGYLPAVSWVRAQKIDSLLT